jgi:hypothetical protein
LPNAISAVNPQTHIPIAGMTAAIYFLFNVKIVLRNMKSVAVLNARRLFIYLRRSKRRSGKVLIKEEMYLIRQRPGSDQNSGHREMAFNLKSGYFIS